VAVCDVRKDRREAVKRMVDTKYGNQDCATYSDIREFLAARTDIDAVLIATSDRWHATASVLAMRAGKDVYCEKPGSMTIAQGQAVVEAARRYARVFQTGTQRLSEANFTVANELLRLGRLGEVRTVRAHIAPWDSAYMNRAWLPAEPEPPRDELDWDAWLGRRRGGLTIRAMSKVAGTDSTIFTRAALVSGARTPSRSATWRWGWAIPRRSSTAT
jgi:predicted dehydrogenase